jgi:hypothetical protein
MENSVVEIEDFEEFKEKDKKEYKEGFAPCFFDNKFEIIKEDELEKKEMILKRIKEFSNQ